MFLYIIIACIIIILLAIHALMISESETQSRILDNLCLVMVANTLQICACARTLLEKLRRRGARGPVCDIAQPSCNQPWLHF